MNNLRTDQHRDVREHFGERRDLATSERQRGRVGDVGHIHPSGADNARPSLDALQAQQVRRNTRPTEHVDNHNIGAGRGCPLERVPGVAHLHGQGETVRRKPSRDQFGQRRVQLDHTLGRAGPRGRDVAREWRGQVNMIREWYKPHMERLYDHVHMRIGDLDQLELLSSQYQTRERFITELTLDPPNATDGWPRSARNTATGTNCAPTGCT